MTSFRLTTPWHTSRMSYGPAVIAPIGAGHAGRMTRHMAAVADRAEKDDRSGERERTKAVELAVGQIEKQFGKGSIMRLGKDPLDREVHVIPSGSLGLDLALGIGGLPRGNGGDDGRGADAVGLHAVPADQEVQVWRDSDCGQDGHLLQQCGAVRWLPRDDPSRGDCSQTVT